MKIFGEIVRDFWRIQISLSGLDDEFFCQRLPRPSPQSNALYENALCVSLCVSYSSVLLISRHLFIFEIKRNRSSTAVQPMPIPNKTTTLPSSALGIFIFFVDIFVVLLFMNVMHKTVNIRWNYNFVSNIF